MTKWRLNHLRQHYMFPNDVQQDTLVQMHYQAGMVLPHTEPAWGLCCGNAAMPFGAFIRKLEARVNLLLPGTSLSLKIQTGRSPMGLSHSHWERPVWAGSNSQPLHEDPPLTARPRNVSFPPLTTEAGSNFKTLTCVRKKGLLEHKHGYVCNWACLQTLNICKCLHACQAQAKIILE